MVGFSAASLALPAVVEPSTVVFRVLRSTDLLNHDTIVQVRSQIHKMYSQFTAHNQQAMYSQALFFLFVNPV